MTKQEAINYCKYRLSTNRISEYDYQTIKQYIIHVHDTVVEYRDIIYSVRKYSIGPLFSMVNHMIKEFDLTTVSKDNKIIHLY